MKVKCDHRSKFSNLSNWKEEASCLNWKIYCDDHTSLSSTTAVQIWIISYIFHKHLSYLLLDQENLELGEKRKQQELLQQVSIVRPSNVGFY